MDLKFELNGFHLDYPNIVKNKETLAVTKVLATELMTNGYIVVGDFIKNLTDADLQALTDNMEDDAPNQYQDLILVSEMLATGEGCGPSGNDDEFQSRAHQFITLLILESLHRKGLVKLYHENISFHEDMGDKLLVEKIDGLDYDGYH